MQPTGTQLLLALGAGISQGAPARAQAGPLGFADMLAKARAGEYTTNLPVSVGDGAGLTLSPAQLDRLAVAADRAEAQGANRAVVLLDGRAFTLDVATRTITGSFDPTQANTLSGFDALITLDQTPGAAPGANTTRWQNSLLRALGRALTK